MKTLCITGSVQSRLDPFAERLKQAGASAALPARTDHELSMADWHRQVLALQKEHEPLATTGSPGHDWQRLAGEIFLANRHRPLWYWAETDSTLLLDFWSGFDPDTFFLLLHVSPHEALTDAVEQGADTPEALQNALDDWYKRTRQMLRFHFRHPGRSLLLDSHDALGQTGAYLDVLARRWQLPLETAESEHPWRSEPHRPTLYLVDKLLQQHPQALALHHEVQASLFLIDHSEAPLSIPELDDVVSAYLKEQRLLKTSQVQLADTSRALQERQARLAALETDHRQLQTQNEQYRQELTETRGDLENSDQENRLLLEQLRHTRENLERLTTENQHKNRQLAELNAEREALQNTFDEQSERFAATCGDLENAEQEGQLLLDQLHQTQEALEKLLLEERHKTQLLATLETDRQQLLEKTEQYRLELSATRGDLESSEQESQLLLDQLHQTQEELEKLLLEERHKTQLLATLETDRQQLLEKTEQYRLELSATRGDLENTEQEGQLLLDQLHQTQEELEKLLLEEQRKTQLLASLSAEKHSLLTQLDALGKEKAALAAARDEQTKLASERKTQLDTLAKEKADLLASRDALAKEKTTLVAARDEQAKLANDRKALLDTLAKEKADLLASRDALGKEKATLVAARDEQAKLANDRKAQLDALAKEKTDLLASRDTLDKEKAALVAARDEQAKLANDRKIQLDTQAKEKADLLAARDALGKEKAALVAARDEQAKLANDRKAQLDALAKEKTDLVAARDTLGKEKAALAAARDEQTKLANDRKAQLDTLAKEKADLLASRDALGKEKAALAAARDEQARLASEQQSRLDALTKEHEQLQSQASRTLEASENEQQQLLIQLHQTQEELEHTLLRYQTSQAQLGEQQELLQKHEQLQGQANRTLEASENENQQLLVELHQTQEELERVLLRDQASQVQLDEHRARLQKVLRHHPDYWDFDTLEIELLKSDKTQQITQWRLTELYIGGRLIPEIRFKTCLANGLAGIVIQRTAGTNSPAPLLRWPNAFAAAEELPCIPTRGASTQGSNAALSGLSTSDWDTLQRLTRQLAGLLAQPTDGQIPKKLNAAALRNGLLAFAKTLANWPRMLRYDSIQLQETLNAPGYERLGIGLGNLRLGNHHWPALDYRLATVDHGPQPFGQNPRLEFPDGSARGVLQHWFEESNDNNNPRLELRFAQPNAMDTRVWGMLSPNDQQLIGALIKTLPLQLEELQQANPAANRPWQDWQALAGMLRDTLRDILIRSTAPHRTPAEIEE